MCTHDTTAWVCDVSQCGKSQHGTCTHGTHFKSTVGLPRPVLNPTLDADSEQMHVNNLADDIHQWFDEDGEASRAPDNILDTIKLWIKEVKKFHTAYAFKAFTDLVAVIQYVEWQNCYGSNPKCTQPCLNASIAIARHCGKGDSTGSCFA